MTPPDAPRDDARAAAIAWHRDQQRAICDRIQPCEHGELLRACNRPSYWDYNGVYADTPVAGVDVEALAGLAERHHGDLAHRHVQEQDEAAGRRLRPAFEAMGWKATPLVFMAHAGELPAVPGDLTLREAPDEEAEPLRRRWYPEDEWARDPQVLEAFLREEREVHAVLGGHVVLVDGDEGPIAYVRVRIAGDVGEVAEAYVVPEARGRGIGAALVAAGAQAIAAAGASHNLIVADGDGRPQHLYGRLGFRPVWTLHQFLRLPRS